MGTRMGWKSLVLELVFDQKFLTLISKNVFVTFCIGEVFICKQACLVCVFSSSEDFALQYRFHILFFCSVHLKSWDPSSAHRKFGLRTSFTIRIEFLKQTFYADFSSVPSKRVSINCLYES